MTVLARAVILCALLLSCQSVWSDGTEDVPPENANTGNMNLVVSAPAPIAINLPELNNGVIQLKSAFLGNYVSLSQNFKNNSPTSLNLATQSIPDTTVGWMILAKPEHTETVMNLGWRFGSDQQLVVSMAQLRADVELNNRQNSLNQYSSGFNYRYFINRQWITGLEWSSYASVAPSQLEMSSINTEERLTRIAGSNLVGMRVGLETNPFADVKLKFDVGSERLSYDMFSGAESSQNVSTSIKWSQILMPTVQYNASMEGTALQRKLVTGLDFNLRDGQRLGIKVARKQLLDGQTADNAINLAYTYEFGKKFNPFQSPLGKAAWQPSLVPEVLQRPVFLPTTLLAKPDGSFN